MKRYELSDGKSHKFWSVGIEGTDVTTQWGRIGTNGQSKTKSFDSVEAAEKELEKVTRSKTKKGYTLAGEEEPAGSAPAEKAVAKKPAAKTVARTKAPTKKAKAKSKKAATEKNEAEGESPSASNKTEASKPTRAVTKELPDESSPNAATLNDYLPPRRPFDAMPIPTVERAWKRLLGRAKSVSSYSLKERDKCHEKWGTRLNAAIKGELPALSDDPNETGHMVALARHCVDWNWQVDAFADIVVARGGLAYAVRATIASFAWGAERQAKLKKTESLGVRSADHVRRIIWRLRAYLCGAGPGECDEALGAARELAEEPLSVSQRVALSALFPDAADLRDEALQAVASAAARAIDMDPAVNTNTKLTSAQFHVLVAESGAVAQGAAILMWDVKSVEEFETLAGHIDFGSSTATLASALDRLGAVVADRVTGELVTAFEEQEWHDKGTDAFTATLLACTPSDKALEWLIGKMQTDHMRAAVALAGRHYPVRALRLLGPVVAGRGKTRDAAEGVVAAVLREYPAALDAASGSWNEATKKRVLALADEMRVSPPASLDECPEVLRAPRWHQKRAKTKKRKPLKLERLPYDVTMTWPEGLQDQWRTRVGEYGAYSCDTEEEWERAFKRSGVTAALLSVAPEKLARKKLAKWRPGDSWYTGAWAFQVVARYEEGAHTGVAHYLTKAPAAAASAALPFDDPAFSLPIASAYRRLKTARKPGRAWLQYHPEAALVGLLPFAFGAEKKSAADALAGIAFLVSEGHGDLLVEVGARYGEEAEAWAKEISLLDPLDQLPKKMPVLPDWTAGVTSPDLNAGGSLPAEALNALLMMLAISKPGEAYPGIEIASSYLSKESLARLSWSLFEAWRLGGMESKQNWAFTQMGLLGDDTCARKLTPILRVWPGDGGHARATVGLEVLAAIGTDVALMNLYGISQKLKFKGLKAKAGARVQEIAAERGLSELELADRLVPDFDLDENGTLTLDFGPRTFVIGFDEGLKPVIRDGSDKVRKSLPKVGANDDEEKGAAATALFRALKKDVKTVAAMQVARLEDVMCQNRTWTQDDFRRFLVEHPLLINLVRRLVWGVYDTDEKLLATFRVAEDGSLATAGDDEYSLASVPHARIGIVHRLHLSDEVAGAWGEVFADYEILQPFDQLGRGIYRLTKEEIAAKAIGRVDGLTVPTGKVLRLEKFGWRRGDPQDGGGIWWMERASKGGVFVLPLDPGIVVGMPGEFEEQKLGAVTLQGSAWGSGKGRDLSGAAETLLSEVIRSIESVRG